MPCPVCAGEGLIRRQDGIDACPVCARAAEAEWRAWLAAQRRGAQAS